MPKSKSPAQLDREIAQAQNLGKLHRFNELSPQEQETITALINSLASEYGDRRKRLVRSLMKLVTR